MSLLQWTERSPYLLADKGLGLPTMAYARPSVMSMAIPGISEGQPAPNRTAVFPPVLICKVEPAFSRRDIPGPKPSEPQFHRPHMW
jgi:hypothetical protein